MRLKTFNAHTLPQGRKSSSPYISISSATGLVRIYPPVAEAMGLNHGSQVMFLQDEECKTDWYVAKHPDGYPVAFRGKDSKTKALSFNNMVLVKRIMDSLDFESSKTETIRVDLKPRLENGLNLFSLSTKALIHSKGGNP